MNVENKSLFSHYGPHDLALQISERLRREQMTTMLPKDTMFEYSVSSLFLFRSALVFVIAVICVAVTWTYFFPDCEPDEIIGRLFSFTRRRKQRTKDVSLSKVSFTMSTLFVIDKGDYTYCFPMSYHTEFEGPETYRGYYGW